MTKYRKLSDKRRWFYILTIIAAILASFATTTLPETIRTATKSGSLEITFIDVGQGDSALIETPEGETILIDGGEFDTYSSHLEPFLDSKDIDKVDTAVVTHYHSDHSGGIYELADRGKVAKLVLPEYEDTDTTRSDLETAAKATRTEIEYISKGDFLKNDCKDLTIEVLHPKAGGLSGNNFHNNSSLVLWVKYFDTSFLITGDIEARAEKEIIKTYDVECDVLKVPHHGSSTSSSKNFLDAADPTYAIISAGTDNPYGHPHYEVLDRLENDDIRIYNTSDDGNITFYVDYDGIRDIKFSK